MLAPHRADVLPERVLPANAERAGQVVDLLVWHELPEGCALHVATPLSDPAVLGRRRLEPDPLQHGLDQRRRRLRVSPPKALQLGFGHLLHDNRVIVTVVAPPDDPREPVRAVRRSGRVWAVV